MFNWFFGKKEKTKVSVKIIDHEKYTGSAKDKFSMHIPPRSSGHCVCGCKGRKYSYLTESSINIYAYKNCPARLARKQNEKRKKLLVEQKKRNEWRQRDNDILPARSKAEAELRNVPTYKGKKCKKCGTTEKNNYGFCIACKKVDNSLRKAMRRGAYPESLTKQERLEIISIYNQCKNISRRTGIQHHVDHIRPLAKGGRHHPSNLRIITAEENLKKGAKWYGT